MRRVPNQAAISAKTRLRVPAAVYRSEVTVMKLTVTAIVLTLCSVVAAAQEPSLYQVTVEVEDVRTGKQAITFKEIERTPTTSMVELSALVGGSVSGPMLIVRFMCGLTRTRGEQFFTSRPVSSNPVRMEVTFPKSGPAPADLADYIKALKPGEPIVFSMAQCDLMKF